MGHATRREDDHRQGFVRYRGRPVSEDGSSQRDLRARRHLRSPSTQRVRRPGAIGAVRKLHESHSPCWYIRAAVSKTRKFFFTEPITRTTLAPFLVTGQHEWAVVNTVVA